MSMVGFPLLLIPFAIYNIIAFLMPSVSFDVTLATLTLVSGAEWPITLSDVLLTLGILLLLLEVMKSARPGGKYLTDHLLSFLVFAATAAEFVMWQKFGTSTFFLLVLMAMVDFLVGVSLRGRRAAVQPAPRSAVARRKPEAAAAPLPEPRVEPEPAPAVTPEAPAPGPADRPAPALPPAASVAESVLMDRPEPRPAQPARPAVPATEPAVVAEDMPLASESEPEHAVKAEESSAPAIVEPSPAASPESQPGSTPPAAPDAPKP